MSTSKHYNKYVIIWGIIFLAGYIAIIVSLEGYKLDIKHKNAIEHISQGEDDYTEVYIEKRDSDASIWQSKLNGDYLNGEYINGAIYDMEVYNNYEGDIIDWSVRINIKEDCFLNEAWSGDTEIHQFRDGKEFVYTDNLEYYDIEDIECEHTVADNDLAIILHEGDYIVYKASKEEEEDPITNKAGSCSCGFIFYTFDEDMDFSDIELIYHTYMNVKKSDAYIYYIYAIVLWSFLFIIFVITTVFDYINYNNKKIREKQIEESLKVFIGFIDAKDQYTNGHSTRVARYAALLAKKLGFRENECKDVYYISLMHDCGKCFISDEILKNPGKLSAEQFETMKQHTTKGAELLKTFTSINGISDGAMYHHERYDGLGYPTGKKGEDIPRIARIISVVDSYDTMKTGRTYCEPLDTDRIRQELVDGRGTQFDPVILDAFLQLFDSGDLSEIDNIE